MGQDQGSTPTNVANKRGRPRTAEKKIKLEKEPIHAASSPVNKIITKNTAVIIDTPTHFQVIMTNIKIKLGSIFDIFNGKADKQAF